MSNIQNTVKFLADMGKTTDALGMIFDLCWGAFCDRRFLQVAALVPNPEHRVRSVDFSGDWWYLDDLAEEYLETEAMSRLFLEDQGRRVLAPDPEDDGNEILDWLRAAR